MAGAGILIVDDEADIRQLLRVYLGAQGYRTLEADSGAAARRAVDREVPALALVDLGLPDEDGLALIRQLRERVRMPIIILTGRGETVDKVAGLELGADDYVTKPFDLRELLARIKSVLRRAETAPAAPAEPEALHFSGFELRLREHRLLAADRTEIPLTHGEFKLLATLAKSAQQTLSRDAILDLTHGRGAGPFDRTVDMQIARLRRKLGDDPKLPRLIRSVRGVGYMLACPVHP
ncbi:MAG: DNA-binding response regulator [Lysobacterales bacterium]|nr:Transcriptional regulatory protein OmpR [Xanthomonadales bacterium]